MIDGIFNIKFSNGQFNHIAAQSKIKANIDSEGTITEADYSIPFTSEIYLPNDIPTEAESIEDNYDLQ